MPRGVATSAREQLEAVTEPGKQRRRGQELRPRGGQLDCKRQTVESRTEFRDGGGILLAQLEVRIGRLGTADEELGRLVVCERRHRELLLGRHMQRCAARDDDLQVRRRVQQARDRACGRQDLLEVVHE